MNNSFPPNIDPNLFAITGAIVGAILTGDYSANEINAIGNWFELVGQYMLTAAAQQQLIESRIENSNININSRQHKNGGSAYDNGRSNFNQRNEVDFLMDALTRMEKEIDNLKKNIN